MPHGAADEALAGGGKEAPSDQDVPFGGEWVDGSGGVEVQSKPEDNEEADEVGPDVDRLVARVEHADYAVERGLVEAVAFEDVGISLPGMG